MPPFEVFIVSPGFGGLTAFLAAVVGGAVALRVSSHRREAEKATYNLDRWERERKARSESIDRWWDLWKYMTEAPHEELQLEARTALLQSLYDEARELNSERLVNLTQVYAKQLEESAKSERVRRQIETRRNEEIASRSHLESEAELENNENDDSKET